MTTLRYIIRADGSEAVVHPSDTRTEEDKVYTRATLANRFATARNRYNAARAAYVWYCDGPRWSAEWTAVDTAVADACARMDRAEAVMARWEERLAAIDALRPPREIRPAATRNETKGTR